MKKRSFLVILSLLVGICAIDVRVYADEIAPNSNSIIENIIEKDSEMENIADTKSGEENDTDKDSEVNNNAKTNTEQENVTEENSEVENDAEENLEAENDTEMNIEQENNADVDSLSPQIDAPILESEEGESINEYSAETLALNSAPNLISVTSCRDSGLRLEWTASSKASDLTKVKYMILRSTDNGRSYQGLVNREAKYGLYFIDATGLEIGKTYYYKVREFIDGVQQQDSNVISATAIQSGANENEFTEKSAAANYLKEKMVQREEKVEIIYNASSFPSGLAAELYDLARLDSESTDSETADEGDYLRYTIVPGTIKIATGIDGKVGANTSYTFSYSLKYYTSKEDEEQVTETVNSILKKFQQDGITRTSSEYDRAKAVYEYLSATIHYNNKPRPDNGNLMITAYDALVRKEAQCYGQLLGAYRLLKELGLPVRRINGETNVELDGKAQWRNHGWNIVKIGNAWYNFDVTAASSYFEGYGQKQLYTYKYLLCSEKDLNNQYVRDDEHNSGSEFYKTHSMASKSFGSEPEAPSTLELTVKNKSTITARYSAVNGAEGYILLRADNEKGPFVQVGNSTTTQCEDKTVEPGRQYHYKVQAYRKIQGYTYCSAYSPRRIITAREVGTPLDISATANSYNTVMLKWSSAEDIQFYELWRSINAEDSYQKVAVYDSQTLSCINKNLKSGTTYYYKIRGYRFSNSEKVYGAFTKVVNATPKLAAPQNVQAKGNSYNTVKISWSLVDGADYYQVYRSTSANGKYVQLGTYDNKTTNSISRKLGCGTTYYYKVRAYCWAGGERAFGSFSKVANATPILGVPQNVQTKSNTYNSLKISWNLVDGAEYYQVYRSTSANGKYALLGTYDSKTNNSISRMLKCGTTYYYKVRGYRWVGGERIFSKFSTPITGKPALPTPKLVTAVRASSSSVNINWKKVEGAEYYQIYRATSTNGNYSLIGTYTGNTTSAANTSLTKGKKYYYKIRAYRWVDGKKVFSQFSAICNATL